MLRRACFIAVACLLAASGVARSYSSYSKWASSPVTFYVNPVNHDVSQTAAVNAIQTAMGVWNSGGSSFRYQYGGVVNDTATALDNRNVLFFRNATNGSAIASTYSWWDANQKLIDSDIVVWDAGFNFFTGIIGCGLVQNAAYVEDIATHEFGHALGLNHSTVTDATMYPSYGYCSQTQRTLATDDLTGLRALYPAATQQPINTAPVVTITSPANNASFPAGTTLSLAATATDAQEGNISSRVTWTDNGLPAGTGSLLSSILSLIGVHTLVATVTDAGGLTSSSAVTVTITLLSQPSLVGALTVSGWRTPEGSANVNLTWKGLPGTKVDIYRNTTKILVTDNDGAHTDAIGAIGRATYRYQVCMTGTQTCTPIAKAAFY